MGYQAQEDPRAGLAQRGALDNKAHLEPSVQADL